MEEVVIRLSGTPGDAVRAIEEVKAALASLTDKTVHVRIAQEGLNRVSRQAQQETRRLAADEQKLGNVHASSLQGRANASRDYLRAMKDEDRAWEQHARTVENSMRRITRASGGGGGGGRRTLGGFHFPPEGFNTKNFLGLDLGRGGIKPRTGAGIAAIGAGAGLIKPLESLLGLAGAIPAAMGAAGIAVAAFSSIGGKALSKVVTDQAKATEKFKQGTITADAYHKAMKNALVGVSAEQRKALPFFQQWHDVVLRTSDAMASKMLPALGALGVALKSNKSAIVGAFGTGAGSISGAMTRIGGFLQSRQGQAGVGALASSSTNFLAGMSSGAVNVFRSFLDIARAARPLVNKLSEDITRITAKFAAWTGSFRGQQAMRQFFLDGEKAAGQFLRVIGNVAMAIHNIGGGVGSGFLDWLEKITQRFQTWTENTANVDRLAAALKRVADTLMVIGQAIGTAAPKLAAFADFMTKTLGPNTLGWLLIGKSLGGGKIAGKIGGGLLDKALGGGAVKAAATGGGAAGGGALAGMGLTAAGVGAVAVALAGVGAAIVYTQIHSRGVRDAWTDVGVAIDKAKGKAQSAAAAMANANTAQRARVRRVGELTGQLPGARLGLLDAQSQLSADKAALPGLKGVDAKRMKLQIEVDSQQVKDAEKELDHLIKILGNAKNAARRHADDSREAARGVADATQSERSALEQATDAAAKHNRELARTGPGDAKAAGDTKRFAANMAALAGTLRNADGKAAQFASTAATLAKQIGRIPTTKEINIAIIGATTAEDSLRELNRLSLGVTKRISVVTGGGGQGNSGKQGADAYAGAKITTPTVLVGEQAPTHPEYVIATNPAYRGRNQKLMAQAASAMGGSVQFFAQGGIRGTAMAGAIPPPGRLPAPRATPAVLMQGAATALQYATAYATGSGSASGVQAAAEYAAIPGKMAALKREIANLTKLIRGDDSFLDHEKDVILGLQRKMRAEKDKGKKERLRQQIENIRAHVVPGRKNARKSRVALIKKDNQSIEDLVAQLGLVPGEQDFQDLVNIIEGQQAAAGEVGRPDLATALKAREIDDYKKRIGFLVAFTSQKSIQRDKNLWAQASSALSGRREELSSLTQIEETGSAGSDTSGADASKDADNQQALAMLAELANYARQGRLSDLIGDEELKTAMQFISQQVGSFAKGSPFIAKSGLAEVHYGEAIVTAAENQRNNKTGPLEGTIVLKGSDDLTRALAAALGGRVNVQLGRDARRRRREGQF